MDIQERCRLLELAAKAIGWTILDWYGDRHTAHDGEKLVPWNPLADDGDALRLAVKLRFSIHVFDLYVLVETGFDDGGFREASDDLNAALRLAIVRAAAAIGEKMEEEKIDFN